MATPQLSERVDVNYDPVNEGYENLLDPKQNEGLVATFYNFAEKNAHKSQLETRPIFDDKVFIRIERVGDKLSVNEREATDYDKARFIKEYEAFLRGDVQMQGIPIETLPGLSVGRIAELKAVKIHSIQSLASVPDSALKFIGMDAISLRQRAITFLAAMKDQAGEQAIAEVRQQAEGSTTRLDAVEHAVADLGAQMTGIAGMLQTMMQNQAAVINAQAAVETESQQEKDIV